MSKTMKQNRTHGLLTKQALPFRSPAVKAWSSLDDDAREDVAASAIDSPLGVVETLDELLAVTTSHALDLDRLRGQLQAVMAQLADIAKRMNDAK